MLTIEKLKEYGANVEEGLARCLNNEAFYLRLVLKTIDDNRVSVLENAINNKEYKQAFELAHSLKGVYGNLSLSPLFNIVCEITELLRANKDIDYSNYLEKLNLKFNELKALSE